MLRNLYLTISCFIILGTSITLQSQTTTVLWDASYSMYDKDLQSEINLLKAYLLQDQAVRFISYANTIQKDTIFKNVASNFDALEAFLLEVNYDGSSSLPQQLSISKNDLLLHFTDVMTTKALASKHYLISSKTNVLNNDIPIENPFYINITETETAEVTNLINETQPKTTFIENNKVSYQKQSKGNTGAVKINGRIFDDFGNLPNVKITNITTAETTNSKDDGTYEIFANLNDFIRYEMADVNKTIKITSVKPITINLPLIASKNSLDEVILEQKSEEEVKVLGNTREDTKNLGYQVVTVNAEDAMIVQKTNVGEFVKGRVPGIKLNSKNDLGSSIIRGYSSIQGDNHPLVFIDGIQTEVSTKIDKADYNFIDPNAIESIKVLKSLAATAIYGPGSTNGVILITTKKNKNASGIKTAPGRNNIYNDSELIVEEGNAYSISLQNNLDAQGSINKAYKEYLKERFSNDTDLQFYFAASDYFNTKKDFEKATTILSNIEELYGLNQKEQTALAYELETKNKNYDALSIYQTLESLGSSNQLQRNKAALQYNLKQTKESLNTYLQLINNDRISEDMREVLISEIRHLYTTNPEAFKGLNIQSTLKQRINVDGRIVFEWNDPSANFQLQFVNPDKLFYNWSHLEDKDFEKISKERETDSSIKEFLLVDAEKGNWFFNILKPEGIVNPENSFIKMTTYKNYGSPQEFKETKLISLNFDDPSKTVARVYIK